MENKPSEPREAAPMQTAEDDQQTWRNAAARAQQALEPLRARATTAYTTAQQKSSEAIDAAEGYIRKSPLRAVAYTAGVAALLGVVGAALMGRRSSKPDDHTE